MIKLKVLGLFGLFMLLLNPAFAQEKTEKPNFLKRDLNKYFPKIDVDAHIMSGIELEARQAELSAKIKTGITNNKKWFTEYVKAAPQTGNLPYHENMGVTKAEYNEYIAVKTVPTYKIGDNSKLKINKTDSTISFKGGEGLGLLNTLTIDLKTKEVSYKNYQLPYKEASHVSQARNAFKSKWHGHTWLFENPVQSSDISLESIKQLNKKLVKLTIGKLEGNGKTFVKLREDVLVNGEKTTSESIVITF